MKKLLVILSFLVLVSASYSETRVDRVTMRNELRIGWGDQLFESLVWHDPASVVTSMPADYSDLYHEDYQYLQHVFVEYQRRSCDWLSIGLLLDGSAVTWTDVTRNGLGQETFRDPGHSFYNIVVMPIARATYFHHPNLNFYSSLGLGVLINGGTEVDIKGRHTLAAPAFDVRLFGLSVNYRRCFFTVDYGGMYSLRDSNTIFLVKSRMFTASLGVRF